MFVAAVPSAALPLVSGASGDGPFVKMAATPSSGAPRRIRIGVSPAEHDRMTSNHYLRFSNR
jgi:hypothetical protein